MIADSWKRRIKGCQEPGLQLILRSVPCSLPPDTSETIFLTGPGLGARRFSSKHGSTSGLVTPGHPAAPPRPRLCHKQPHQEPLKFPRPSRGWLTIPKEQIPGLGRGLGPFTGGSSLPSTSFVKLEACPLKPGFLFKKRPKILIL